MRSILLLTVDGPVGLVREPEGRPRPASRGHVTKVDDEQSAIEPPQALESNGIPRTLRGVFLFVPI